MYINMHVPVFRKIILSCSIIRCFQSSLLFFFFFYSAILSGSEIPVNTRASSSFWAMKWWKHHISLILTTFRLHPDFHSYTQCQGEHLPSIYSRVCFLKQMPSHIICTYLVLATQPNCLTKWLCQFILLAVTKVPLCPKLCQNVIFSGLVGEKLFLVVLVAFPCLLVRLKILSYIFWQFPPFFYRASMRAVVWGCGLAALGGCGFELGCQLSRGVAYPFWEHQLPIADSTGRDCEQLRSRAASPFVGRKSHWF